MMVQIMPSSACRCTWWDGKLTSSTGMTITSWTRTTVLALARTCTLTHYSRPILTSCGCYALKTLPQPCFQCNPKTCPTTASHESYNPTPLTHIPTPTTVKLSFQRSWWTIVMASATYLTFPLSLVILVGWHRQPPVLSTTTISLVMLCRYRNSVWQSTPSKGDTLLRLFSLETCHSMSKWFATATNWDAPYFRNSHHVDRSLVLQMTCSITFVHWGTPLSSWLHDSFPSFSKQQHNHQVLAGASCNHLGLLSHTFALNHCCHCPPRTWHS